MRFSACDSRNKETPNFELLLLRGNIEPLLFLAVKLMKSFSRRIAARGGSTVLVLLSLFTLLVLVGLWTTTFWYIQKSQQNAIGSAVTDMDNLVRTYEESTLRAIRHFDQVAKFIKFEAENHPALVDLKSVVDKGLIGFDAVILVSVVNENGDFVTTTIPGADKTVSIKDREHFKVHIAQDTGHLYVSEPVIGRISKTESLNLTRRINHPDGTFAGVVVVSVKPAYFTHFYNAADFGKNGLVGLLGSDGRFRAVRVGESNRNNTFVNFADTLAQVAASRKSLGAAVSIEGVDKEPRFIAYRQLADYPLTVLVGVSKAEVLAPIRREAYKFYWGSVVASLIVLLFYSVTALALARLRAREASMERLASADSLTQLPNRLYFQRRLEHEIAEAQRTNRSFGVLFVDLDRFKEVNDSFGHGVGDGMLRAVAKRLKAAVRDTDVVCRLGGDEFTVILSELADEQASNATAGRILDSLEAPFKIDDVQVSIGASIGLSVYPQDGTNLSALVRHADRAMYVEKERGRNPGTTDIAMVGAA